MAKATKKGHASTTVSNKQSGQTLYHKDTQFGVPIKSLKPNQRYMGFRYINSVKITTQYQSAGIEVGVVDLPYPITLDEKGVPTDESLREGFEYAAEAVDEQLAKAAQGLDKFLKQLAKKYR